MWINIVYKNKNRKLINLNGTANITIEHSYSDAAFYIGYEALLIGSSSYMEKQYGKILLALKDKDTICNIYEEGVLE